MTPEVAPLPDQVCPQLSWGGSEDNRFMPYAAFAIDSGSSASASTSWTVLTGWKVM
jgi:hypothetical protein